MNEGTHEAEAMKRVAKHEGLGNIVVEDAPRPAIGPRQVLVRNRRSLISRGSEIGARYLADSTVDSAIMGYSSAGVVEQTGALVTEVATGQRVAVVAPHAEYVVGDLDSDVTARVTAIPDGVSSDVATFHTLVTAALMWVEIAGIQAGDTVAILGQGLVGNLVLQAVRAYRPARVITVDALPLRCALASRLGADVTINAATDDPVRAVLDLTGGQGAEVVIDCVGGKAGVRSFIQAQAMCRRLGTIHLIALYHGEPLPLDSAKIQGRRLLGGYVTDAPFRPYAARAMAALRDGAMTVEPLITHHFRYTAAKDAFDLLYHRPDEALGVILMWSNGEVR